MSFEKIHNQSPSGLGAHELSNGGVFDTKLPFCKSPRTNFYEWAKGSRGGSFDVILFQELQRLKKRDEDIRQSMAEEPSPSQLLDYKNQFQSLAQSIKLLEIVFTHMERACQSIVANFR